VSSIFEGDQEVLILNIKNNKIKKALKAKDSVNEIFIDLVFRLQSILYFNSIKNFKIYYYNNKVSSNFTQLKCDKFTVKRQPE
jgi:hypothetical protein